MPADLLARLVAIPSVTGNEAPLAAFCQEQLEAHGFSCARQALPDGRFNLLATRGEAPPLLLYAHLDTVPPDPAWTQDPYTLSQLGDRLIGLGASDMKGGIAVLLAAVAATDAPVRIALGADEEAWSAGAWELVRSGWCAGVRAVLVPELSIDSDSEVLGLGRRGHAAFEIVVSGPRAHGAVALPAAPAIEQACRLVLALRAACPADEQLLVRDIAAAGVGLTVPERCTLSLSCLTSRSQRAVQAELTALAADYGGVVSPVARPTPAPEAYAVAATDPSVDWVQQAAREVLGAALPTAIGVSVADENVLAGLGVPVLSLAPVGGRSHRAGEWTSQTSLARTSSLYAHLIARGLPKALTAGL